MKVLLFTLLIALGSAFIYRGPKTSQHEPANARGTRLPIPPARKTSLTMQKGQASEKIPQDPEKRKLFLDDLQQNYGAYDLSQMQNTNTQVYEMQAHNRRNVQLRQMGAWFGDLDFTVDDYRDSISKKLDQLNMSLQRPKIPVPGFGAAMTLPFANMPATNLLPQGLSSLGINSNQNQVFGINSNNQPYSQVDVSRGDLNNSAQKEPNDANSSEDESTSDRKTKTVE